MGKNALRISDTLTLPLSFTTQTQAILARKRRGKSYTASVMAEELLKAKQQIIVIDVTGAWWGLRAGADGDPAGGYPVNVFGGDHGDMSLDKQRGERMAEIIVKDRVNSILDLSYFRKGEMLRFLADFFETLYKVNRDPVHLFADECDAYAPQKPMGDDARTLGAMDDIVRRGGIRGIGCTMISQRPAVINKNILTQCNILTVLTISHQLDLKPIEEWTKLHDTGGMAEKALKTLPALPIGTAWIWAPDWPDTDGLFKQFQVRRRETFDSGATPKPGEKVRAPKKLHPVDLTKLSADLARLQEEVESNKPETLKKKLAAAENRIRMLETAKAKPVPAVIDSDAVQKQAREAANHALRQLKPYVDDLLKQTTTCKKLMADLTNKIETVEIDASQLSLHLLDFTPVNGKDKTPEIKRTPLVAKPVPVTPRAPMPAVNPDSDGELGKCERAVLQVLSNYESCEMSKIALLAGYRVSGGFRNALSKLRTLGYITGDNGSSMQITEAGLNQGPFDPLPSGYKLYQYWQQHNSLGKAEREILQALHDTLRTGRSDGMTIEEIASCAGYSISGGFRNALSTLRTAGLITGRNGEHMHLSTELQDAVQSLVEKD